MSAWDDEDFEVNTAAVRNNFDDEDSEELLDDWEAAGDSEEEEVEQKPLKNKVGAEQRKAEREAKEQADREKKALAKGEEDEKTRKERLKQAEIDSDLSNAASLLGSVDIHPRAKKLEKEQAANASMNAGPQKLSDLAIFKPTTKSEFESLRKTLAPLLQELNETSQTQYANFVTELSRDLCKPLAIDKVRTVSSTLTALQNEKMREERANRGKKKKPVAKAASLKVDDAKDTTNYEDFDADEDFM